MKLTCSKCFGNKTYRGMGSMMMKCEPCNGLGHIELKTELPTAEVAPKKTRKVNFEEKRTD